MTTLTIFADDQPERVVTQTAQGSEIERLLGKSRVRFERWKAGADLSSGADQPAILAAYHPEVDRLMTEGGYKTADVIRLKPDHPDKVALRAKFLDEHTHAEDEVRFFVEGSGAFYLHLDGKVHQIVCEKDDLLSVPAGNLPLTLLRPEPPDSIYI